MSTPEPQVLFGTGTMIVAWLLMLAGGVVLWLLLPPGAAVWLLVGLLVGQLPWAAAFVRARFRGVS